jgi:hypothetical protein
MKMEDTLVSTKPLEDEEDLEVLPPIELNPVEKKQPKLKSLPGYKEVLFKQYSETQYMYESRKAIIKRLETLREETGVITRNELEMISRMINNKIWYNETYDETTESYLSYILELI